MSCLTWIRGIKVTLPFKDNELNKIAAFFNVSTFLLTCAALVQPSWFRIKGLHCTQSLSLTQFFTFDEDDDENYQIAIHQDREYDLINRSDFIGLPPCTTPEIITLMRILILLCFMVLLCSCIGVLINLTSLNSKAIKMLRRNAVPSIMCVFWVIAIVGVCYYTTVVLGNANNSDPNTIQVDYEYGFYTITGAGMYLCVFMNNVWCKRMSLNAMSQELWWKVGMDLSCVFWVIAIVGVCYYTTVVLGNANNSDPNTIQVDYEYGFYTITGAGMHLCVFMSNVWCKRMSLNAARIVVESGNGLVLPLGYELVCYNWDTV